MDLRETGWGRVEWIQLAQDRDRCRVLVNIVMNLRVLAPWSELVIYNTYIETVQTSEIGATVSSFNI
jgi:hypothetical protein